MSFSDVPVLVTGGSSGVGADIAEHFAQMGARVTITGRRKQALDEVAQRSDHITPFVCDITDEKSVKSLFEECGPFQIVIANAGIAESAPVTKTETESWNRILATNATGPFLTLREGLKGMTEGGRFIAIASILGLRGAAYTAAYTASKHAVVGLVRATAKEVAAKGVTVNALCPGYLDTEMTDKTIANIIEKTGMDKESAIKAITKNNPQGRLIAAEEVTAMVLFLASSEAQSINGQAIPICGGEIC